MQKVTTETYNGMATYLYNFKCSELGGNIMQTNKKCIFTAQ
jgi:hypothetical protein